MRVSSARVRAAVLVVSAALLAGCGSAGGGATPAAHGRGPAQGSLASSGAGHRFYEIYDPTGPARGTMIMIHGGGWQDQRGWARRYEAGGALSFRAAGWRVVNVSYTAGRKPAGAAPNPVPMMRDVVAFYDQVRRAFGGPICAYGESAGGQLAAMLAIERPQLTCAILNAAPFDLPLMLRHSLPSVQTDVRLTFGTSARMLDAWSPDKQWRPRVDHTAVFATAASNDQAVPPDQLKTFVAVDRSVNAQVVAGAPAGSPNSVAWEHSSVSKREIFNRAASISRWLDQIVPRSTAATAQSGTDAGADCELTRSGDDRFKLMLAGDAWQQQSTPGQPIAATRGCSGSARWQDDGLSLWALPSSAQHLVSGAQATLLLQTARTVHRLTAVFRGFLARPREWLLGLYASTGAPGAGAKLVAGCDAGRCTGLRLFSTAAGDLVGSSNSPRDPDQANQPPSASFNLPPGTRGLAWLLRCVAASGCSIAGIAPATGSSPRPRDPLGHPAIFSLYRVDTQ